MFVKFAIHSTQRRQTQTRPRCLRAPICDLCPTDTKLGEIIFFTVGSKTWEWKVTVLSQPNLPLSCSKSFWTSNPRY